jgi:UDP-N-acetylglucosamine 4,6-dehydratase
MNILTDANILITGGTGAFGRAFTRFALDSGARRVGVLSRDEVKHTRIAREIPDPRLRCFVGDVRDAARVRQAAQGVDYILHAAAMKRVDHCEADPDEAIATNIVGSQNVAHAAIDVGAKCAVFLSTDKAAAPSTLYGLTKGVAERAWVQSSGYADGTGTRFVATRYGNVLDSTGSVVPLWREQAAKLGYVSVTDPAATRFWMTMADAVALVLRAMTIGQAGETFVPHIGAANLLQLKEAVTTAATNCLFIGLRSGEKLHETLIGADETSRTRQTSGGYIIEPAAPSWAYEPRTDLPYVGGGFVLASNTTPQRLSVSDLNTMLT